MRGYRDASALPASFLQKTYDILENDELKEIINWNDPGTAFLVKNVTEFCDRVLPIYFKHSNYASFVRQLNMYGFHKVREGFWENAFRHPLFLRGKPELLKEIRRKTADTHSATTQSNMAISATSAAILPAGLLTRSDCDDLTQKLYTLQRKQHQMDLRIQSLEDRNGEILEYSKSLFRELCYYKDREQKIERLLVLFASCVQNVGRGKDGEVDPHDLLMSLAPQQKTPMLMDQQALDSTLSDDSPRKKARTSPPVSPACDTFDFDFLLGEQG